jgi:hypothetical protein
MQSGRAGLPRGALQPTSVTLPPGLIAGRHVVVVLPEPDGAVDELPDDVGVAGVPVGLGDHVREDPLQRDLAPLLRPPRHLTDGIQRQGVDRGVRMGPDTVVQTNDLFPRQSLIGMRKGSGGLSVLALRGVSARLEPRWAC